MALHLITPGWRADNIIKIAKNLKLNYYPGPYIWHIIMDKKIGAKSVDTIKDILPAEYYKIYEIDCNFSYGYEQRNYFLTHICKNYDVNVEWGYFLDDDNFVTQDIFDCYHKYLNLSPEIKLVLMSQLRYNNPNKRLFGKPECARVSAVDIGNWIFRLNLLKDIPFPVYISRLNLLLLKDIPFPVNSYAADGYFIEYLKDKHPEYFAYENEFITTYNILQL